MIRRDCNIAATEVIYNIAHQIPDIANSLAGSIERAALGRCRIAPCIDFIVIHVDNPVGCDALSALVFF